MGEFELRFERNRSRSYLTITAGPPDANLSVLGLVGLSIRKWEMIVDEFAQGALQVMDGASDTCALCGRFFFEEYNNDVALRWLGGEEGIACRKCPVRVFTGHEACEGTPYTEYARDDSKISSHAEDELAFLKEVREFVASGAYEEALSDE